MKIEYDREADALYISLQDKQVSRTIELSEGVNVDLDDQGGLVGIEVLDATERYSLADIFDLKTKNLFIDETILSKSDLKMRPDYPKAPESATQA
jgi:uncharacterized protein YuzE